MATELEARSLARDDFESQTIRSDRMILDALGVPTSISEENWGVDPEVRRSLVAAYDDEMDKVTSAVYGYRPSEE